MATVSCSCQSYLSSVVTTCEPRIHTSWVVSAWGCGLASIRHIRVRLKFKKSLCNSQTFSKSLFSYMTVHEVNVGKWYGAFVLIYLQTLYFYFNILGFVQTLIENLLSYFIAFHDTSIHYTKLLYGMSEFRPEHTKLNIETIEVYILRLYQRAVKIHWLAMDSLQFSWCLPLLLETLSCQARYSIY